MLGLNLSLLMKFSFFWKFSKSLIRNRKDSVISQYRKEEQESSNSKGVNALSRLTTSAISSNDEKSPVNEDISGRKIPPSANIISTSLTNTPSNTSVTTSIPHSTPSIPMVFFTRISISHLAINISSVHLFSN